MGRNTVCESAGVRRCVASAAAGRKNTHREFEFQRLYRLGRWSIVGIGDEGLELAVVGVRTGRCERRRHPCRPRRAGRAQPTWRQAHHQAPRRCGAAVRAVVRGRAAGSAERWTPGLPKFECAARAAQALTGRRSAALNRNRLQRRPRTPSWLATDRWPEMPCMMCLACGAGSSSAPPELPS